MFELFTSVVLQIFLATGQPAVIGNSGWGGGDVAAPTSAPTSNAIGNSGWGGGDVANPSAPTAVIGNSGWGGGD